MVTTVVLIWLETISVTFFGCPVQSVDWDIFDCAGAEVCVTINVDVQDMCDDEGIQGFDIPVEGAGFARAFFNDGTVVHGYPYFILLPLIDAGN